MTMLELTYKLSAIADVCTIDTDDAWAGVVLLTGLLLLAKARHRIRRTDESFKDPVPFRH